LTTLDNLKMVSSSESFCFPVPSSFENARLKLTPWDTSLHSSSFFESAKPHPELFDYMPSGPYDSREAFDSWFEELTQTPQSNIVFAIFDKTRGNVVDSGFAGMIILVDASREQLATEIGLIILSAFHRTHVTTNAIGLLLHWLLGPTSDPLGGPIGLGFRRVYWTADIHNTRSIALAERLGTRPEAILRWARVLPADRVKLAKREKVRKGDPREECPGRDSARLAVCWDDWMNGGRDKVDKEMQRTS
jgi:RimJ/RimL family protein N-acetyltransferase